MRTPADIQKKTLRNDLFLFLGMTISFSPHFIMFPRPKEMGGVRPLTGLVGRGDRLVAAGRICS